MFGSYRYGLTRFNDLDPTVPGQLASYASDDSGTLAERGRSIRNGILERPWAELVARCAGGRNRRQLFKQLESSPHRPYGEP